MGVPVELEEPVERPVAAEYSELTSTTIAFTERPGVLAGYEKPSRRWRFGFVFALVASERLDSRGARSADSIGKSPDLLRRLRAGCEKGHVYQHIATEDAVGERQHAAKNDPDAGFSVEDMGKYGEIPELSARPAQIDTIEVVRKRTAGIMPTTLLVVVARFIKHDETTEGCSDDSDIQLDTDPTQPLVGCCADIGVQWLLWSRWKQHQSGLSGVSHSGQSLLPIPAGTKVPQ